MKCPLCQNSKYFTLATYELSMLQELWKKTFNIEPFSRDLVKEKLYKLKCTNCDMIFYNPPIIGDELLYKHLSANSWYYEKEKWEYDCAIEYISKYKPANLLEIGCGKGYFLDKVSSAVDAKGLELNNDAVKFCLSKSLDVKNEFLENIPDKYDMIVSFQVFEHIADIKVMLETTLSKLNENGYLLISVPNPKSYLKEIEKPLLDMPPHHNLGFNKQTFDFIADNYNLKFIEYKKEPFRYSHFKWYMEEVYFKQIKANAPKIKNKDFLESSLYILNFIEIYLYKIISNDSVGQTHLAIFQK